MRSVDTFGSNSLKIHRHFKNTFSRKLSLEGKLDGKVMQPGCAVGKVE